MLPESYAVFECALGNAPNQGFRTLMRKCRAVVQTGALQAGHRHATLALVKV